MMEHPVTTDRDEIWIVVMKLTFIAMDFPPLWGAF